MLTATSLASTSHVWHINRDGISYLFNVLAVLQGEGLGILGDNFMVFAKSPLRDSNMAR